ncbi:hypothetical protein [Nonomuraea antri]|uniref:hypothetical protein n=1 Tax=Nonomuraea antri TaxID=2730852 RepID=UPI0015685910|nr:hypothetical protein [Nonomuraea antri]
MSLLERRYRSVLRLLPAAYRAEREEEMVAAFMEMSGDAPDEENLRPRWGEIASVVALATRVRLGGAGSAPRSFAWGATVRLIALLGLAFQSVYAVFTIADLIRAGALRAGSEAVLTPGSTVVLLNFGKITQLGGGALICSAVAFIAIMRGRVRVARIAALLGLLPALIHPFTQPGWPWIDPFWPSDLGYLLSVAVPAIALLLGFHADVPPLRSPWWLTLLPVAIGVVFDVVTRTILSSHWALSDLLTRWTGDPEAIAWSYLWLDPQGLAIVGLVVTGVVVLARRCGPSWALALAVLGVPLLTFRLSLIVATAPEGPNAVLWTTALAQSVLVAALIALLTATGLKALPGKVRPGAAVSGPAPVP